jgi:hypothetical protein
MAVVETVDIAPIISTNAQFQAWGGNISSHLGAAGMVNVSNNINWTTVATPGVINTKAGYEVWRFADALQNTSPVFFKLEYGAGATINQPRLHFQLGSGADTVNTQILTGPVSPPNTYFIQNTANNANVQHCYFSGNTSYFNAWMFMNKDAGVTATGTVSHGLSMERTKDANGADTGQGVLITIYIGGLQTAIWDPKLGMLSPSGFESPAALLVPASGNGTTGSNIAVYPVFHAIGNAFHNPGLAVMGYFNVDIANTTNTTVSVYGSNHTYITTSSQGIVQTGWRSTGIGLLIRYE